MLADTQHAFADWVLGGEATVALRSDVPPGRMMVYRNNVLGSLAGVLAQAYPTVRRVLGDGFDRLARRYAAEAPPRRPMLWSYGAGFAGWLEACPAGTAPWLPDLARLDWAMHEALFAADAEPLDPRHLAAVPPARMGTVRLLAHPSVRLVRSRWAVHALWKDGGADPATPEAVLIGRSGEEVLCTRLDETGGAVAEAVLASRTLDEAAALDGDLQGLLALLLHHRLIAGFALDSGHMAAHGEGGPT